MRFEHLLSKIKLLITFYSDFILNYIYITFNAMSFNWKIANYADSYWFLFNSKTTNHVQSKYTK